MAAQTELGKKLVKFIEKSERLVLSLQKMLDELKSIKDDLNK